MKYTACQTLAIKRLEQFLLDPNEKFFGLSGSGGVGKTHLLCNTLYDIVDTANVVAKTLGQSQRINDITLSAMTHAAVSLLPTGNTFHSVMNIARDADNVWQMNGSVSKGQLLVVDEASMLQQQYVDMPVADGGKVLFSYDAAQLPPVGEELIPVETFLQSRRIDLVTPVRQEASTPLYSTLSALRNAILLNAPFQLVPNADIEFVTSADDYINNLADGVNHAILAYTNNTVTAFNTAVRSKLLNATNPRFVIGEQVILNEHYNKLRNGARFTVTDVFDNKKHSNYYWVVLDGKHTVQAAVDLTLWKQEIKNIYKRPEKERRNLFNEHALAPLTSAYATTIHKAQGRSYDTVLINMADILRYKDKMTTNFIRRLLYVGLSRARTKAFILM